MTEPLGYQAGIGQVAERGVRRRRRLKAFALVGLPVLALVAAVWAIHDGDADPDAQGARMAMTLTVVNQTSGILTNAGFDSEGDGVPERTIGPLYPGQSRRVQMDVPWYETPICVGVVTAAGTARAEIDYRKMFPGTGMVNCTMIVLPGRVRLRCSTPARKPMTADLALSQPNPDLR